MNNFDSEKHKGSVLLFCLGVLALLSLIGIALIFMVRQEDRSAKKWMDETRAEFASDSGVEAALAKISSYGGSWLELPQYILANPADTASPLEHIRQSSFGSEDLDGDGFKEVAGFVSQTHAYKGDCYKLRVTEVQGRLNINDSNAPWNIDTDAYADQRHPEFDYASLPAHLQDPAGQDPDWAYPGGVDYDFNLHQNNKPYPRAPGRLFCILKELAGQLFPAQSSATFPHDLAAAILDARDRLPGGRFSSFLQLREILVPKFLSASDYRRFEDQITLHSWQDEKVLLPSFQHSISRPASDPKVNVGEYRSTVGANQVTIYPQSNFLMSFQCNEAGYHAIRMPKFGTVYNERTYIDNGETFSADLDAGVIAPDWTRSNDENFFDIYLYFDAQTKYFELDPRSPVNLNSASLELVKALIRPLSGWWLRESPETWRTDFDPVKDLTAEDRSVPFGVVQYPTHPWYGGHAMMEVQDGTGFASLLRGLYMALDYFRPEDSRYYYLDEQEGAVLDAHPIATPNTSRIKYPKKSKRFGRLTSVSLETAIADAVAERLYSRVHGAAFNPFSTWAEFEYFLRDLSIDDAAMLGGPDPNFISGFRPEMADLLIANFNPNSRVNDFNPGKEFHLGIDKSKLSAFTTEFCFQSFGWFDVHSLGETRYEGNRVAAGRLTRALLNPGFQTLRLTTQADFMEGYSPADSAKQSSAFLGRSSGPVNTQGLDFSAGVADESFAGCALQSYPQPENRYGENHIAKCRYDGYLALACLGPDSQELFNDVGADFYGDAKSRLMAAHSSFGDLNYYADPSAEIWKADPFSHKVRFFHLNNPTIVAEFLKPTWRWQDFPDTAKIPANRPSPETLMLPLKMYSVDWVPGNLYPDGVFSDAGRSWCFNAACVGDPAMAGRKGSAQFWLKPGFDPAHSNRVRQFFGMAPMDVAPLMLPASMSVTAGGASTVIQPATSLIFRHIDQRDFYEPRAKEAFSGDLSLYYFSHGGANVLNPATDEIPIYDASQGESWIPSRSCFMQARCESGINDPSANRILSSRLSTTSANHSWNGPLSADNLYQLEAGQWSSFAFCWDLTPGLAMSVPRISLFINNKFVEGREQELPRANEAVFTNLHVKYDGTPNYVRFGESASMPFRNHVADSTYGFIAAFNARLDQFALGDEYIYGRYYGAPDAAYSSPELDLFKTFSLVSGSLKLLNASWTLYWPAPRKDGVAPADVRFNGNRNPADSNAYETLSPVLNASGWPVDPMAAVWGSDWAPISLNVRKADGNWAHGNSMVGLPQMPNYAGASQDPLWESFGWKAGEFFQFRLHFNIPDDKALYASPILDDVTFLFLSAKTRVEFWDRLAQ